MNKLLRKYKALSLVILIFNILLVYGKKENRRINNIVEKNVTKEEQYIEQKKYATDTTLKTEKKTSVSKKEETLKGKVVGNADEIRNSIQARMTYFDKNAKVSYQDITIESDHIAIDWDSGEIYARGELDAEGYIVKNAVINQGGNLFYYKEFKYNLKTTQGVAYNIRTVQDDAIILAERIKRLNDSIAFLKDGMITTDTYFKDGKDSVPDYKISFSKIRTHNGKNIMGSRMQLYIEEIPTPLILPDFYAPITKNRSAGLLIGSFGEREDLGFYLDKWGLYVPLGKYLDYEMRFGAYTKGSWYIDNRLCYVKRYGFSGDLNFRYERKKSGTKGLSDFSVGEYYNFIWNHQQDPKANPHFQLSANVNLMSANYYSNSINNSNIINGNVLNNQMNSSITLTKTFENFPFSFILGASSSQDLNSGKVNLILPSLTATLPQKYIFKAPAGGRRGLLGNAYFNYRMNLQNSVDTKDADMFTSRMFDTSRNGLKNEINIGTSASIFKYLQFNLTGNYQEVWTTKTIDKKYDPAGDSIQNNIKDEFSTYRIFSGEASLMTTIYGMKVFNKNAKIQAIRHVMTPKVGFGYAPDFSGERWGYYGSYINAEGKQEKYSHFEGGVFSGPSNVQNSLINLSLSNNLEMKVKSSKDSTGSKKVKIFDYLNVSTSYNMAADSLKWNNFYINGATPLFQDRLRINYAMNVSPYKIGYTPGEEQGRYINDFGEFNISDYTVGIGLNLDNTVFGKPKVDMSKCKNKGLIRNEVYCFDENNYARFNIPWNVNMNFNYNYYKGTQREANKTTSLQVGGGVSPTPYWRIGFTTNYDFQTKKIAYTRFDIERDLRSFKIQFNWVPTGSYKMWEFYIGVKADIFTDALKYEQKSGSIYSQGSSF